MPFPDGHKTLSQLHAEERAERAKKEKEERKVAEVTLRRQEIAAKATIERRKAEADTPQHVDDDVARVLKRLDDPDAEFITSSPE